MFTVGLDVGTTHIKALLLDENLNIKALHIEDNVKANKRGSGCCFEPEEVWEKSLNCIKHVISSVDRKEVAGIGVTSMAETGVPVDKDGNALYPFVPWSDMRAKKQMDKFSQMAGSYDIYKKTGLICHPKYTIARLLWLKENEEDIFNKTRKWLSVADYIIFKLSGKYITDRSLAGRTMLYDIRKKAWINEYTSLIGGDDILPEVIDMGGTASTIKKDLAQELGLESDVKIIAAGHDHLSAATAMNLNGKSEILDSMGTSEVMVGLEDEPDLSPQSFEMGFNHGCFKGDRYYWMTSMPGSGTSIEWLKRIMSTQGPMSYEMFTDESKYDEPSPLYFYPYLNGSGTPHIDPSKRGVLIGIGESTDAYQLIKSIYEGTSYESRWVIESLEEIKKLKINNINVVGGASKNIPWMKTKCDVLGRNIITSSIEEVSAAGAALMAADEVGITRTMEMGTLKKNGSHEFHKQSSMSRIYTKKYLEYKKIYNILKDIYQDWSDNDENNEDGGAIIQSTK